MRQVCGFFLEDGPVLVTGAGGFVASRLMELFQLGEGDIAADRTTDFSVPSGVRRIEWVLPGPPPSSLGEVRYVVHLAALSSVAHSMADTTEVMRVNTEGTESVSEWMLSRSPEARILFAGSAEVYRPSIEPLTEESDLEPLTPYAKSKLAAEAVLTDSELDSVVARSFPHFGPRQAAHFVLPSFCRRIIMAERRGEKHVTTGNLTAVRDYLFVDDVVRAYACLLAKGGAREVYNVCSGTGYSIGELFQILQLVAGVDVSPVIAPDLLREEDQFCQVGDPGKLRSLGWKHEISVHKGLSILYKWWKERL